MTRRFRGLVPVIFLAALLAVPAAAGAASTPESGARADSPPGTAVNRPSDLPDTVWPFDRVTIRRGIADLFDEWHETAFAIDAELVRHVSYFYKYYSIIDRHGTNEIIERSREYLPGIQKIFAEYNLPAELAFAIPFVESAFQNKARSDKKAVGMFQFLARTARSYGLKIGGGVDQRQNFKLAAEACAKYLSENRNIFASTVLSLGSFHHGTNKVIWVLRRLPMKENKRSFDAIFKNRELGKYSKEYIPKCLAASLIYRYLTDQDLAALPEMDAERKLLDRFVHVDELRERHADLLALNPDLVDAKTTYLYATTRGYMLLERLTVPDGSITVALAVNPETVPPAPVREPASSPPDQAASSETQTESEAAADVSSPEPERKGDQQSKTTPADESSPAVAALSENKEADPAIITVTVPKLVGEPWDEKVRKRFPDREILMNESYNGIVDEIGVVFDQNLKAGDPWTAGDILILEVGRPPIPEDELSSEEYSRFIREYMSTIRKKGSDEASQSDGKGETN